MEREGIDSTRGRINRAIKATNEKLLNIVEQLREISAGKLGLTEIFESNEEIKEIDYITVFPEEWTMQDIAVFEEDREHWLHYIIPAVVVKYATYLRPHTKIYLHSKHYFAFLLYNFVTCNHMSFIHFLISFLSSLSLLRTSTSSFSY